MNWMLITSETGITLLLFVIGLMIITWAQIKITSTYKKTKQLKLKKQLSGSEIARMILDNNNLDKIYVIETRGELTDHYDPNRKVIRLSKDIFHGETIAAASVAAHEVGHAIQDKEGYVFMKIRSTLAPIVSLVTYIGYIVSIIALFAGITQYILVGILIILSMLIFQLVTLPVEFDASRRAKIELEKLDLITNKEKEEVDNMLSAAALTYVASFISTILNLLRLVIMYNNKKGR